MRTFACGTCRSLIFFENTDCVTCGSVLGFAREPADLVVVQSDDDGLGATLTGRELRACANRELIGCNWLAEQSAPGGYCGACRLTRVRPNDNDADGMLAWIRTESAKRRLIYELDDLGLPVTPRADDPERGLAFDFLSSAHEPVTTGHADGVVTIDMAEGDDGYREHLREQLAEPYRTLLGHLRHETGHWYWQVLVDGGPHLDAFRSLFGDERADYSAALEEHYGKPMTDEWQAEHVSHYAAAHPWEDWAETFAHYLHMRDTIQTAAAWGVSVDGPAADVSVSSEATLSFEPRVSAGTVDEMLRAWVPLTLTLNALNRSMGKHDLYPFVLPAPVLDKLRFVHERIKQRS